MKKILALLFLAVFFVSCEGPMGPQGPEGPQGPGNNYKVIYYTIEVKDWHEYEDSNNKIQRYYSDVDFYEDFDLDYTYIYKEGTTVAYLYLASGPNNELQIPLPCDMKHVNTNGRTASEQYDMEFFDSYFRFNATFTDFEETIKPVKMKFRIVMMW